MTDFDDCTLHDEDEHYNDMIAGILALEDGLAALGLFAPEETGRGVLVGISLRAVFELAQRRAF